MHQLQEKQRIATAEQSDDADVFGYHFEDGALAVNLFHVRGGKIVDRREFFWEDLPELMEAIGAEISTTGNRTPIGNRRTQPRSMRRCPIHGEPRVGNDTAAFNPGHRLLRPPQAALHRPALRSPLHPRPRRLRRPRILADLLSERINHRVEIAVPQRGEKRSLVDLAGQNAKQSYIQRFRVLEPSRKAIQESLADALMLPELPRRIECFDISHIQGAETVASMVVWEDGKMNKSQYRKFKMMTVIGVDDFASMREVVTRRYRRLKEEDKPMPSLILIDGGLGQLHAAAEALEALGFTSSRSPPSPRRKKSSTSTAMKTSPSSSTAVRPCCISCR